VTPGGRLRFDALARYLYGPAAQGRQVSARLSHPRPDPAPRGRAEIEYYHPMHPGERVRLGSTIATGQAHIWLKNGSTRLASAQLSR
jgi:hypothetical protein